METAWIRGGYAPLPREEHVCACTRDGDDVRCWGGDVRERVVRCADCANGYEFSAYGSRYLVCKRFDEYHHIVEQNGFCAWGEAKED